MLLFPLIVSSLANIPINTLPPIGIAEFETEVFNSVMVTHFGEPSKTWGQGWITQANFTFNKF